MTRLRTEWVEPMLLGMGTYNQKLKEKTGMNLSELVQWIYDIDDDSFSKAKAKYKVSAVSITQGEGIIDLFSQSILAIVSSMGFAVENIGETDVDGIYHCLNKNVNIIFMADDVRYIALNTERNFAADNNYGTALGYIKVLEALMNRHGFDICKERIMVIGCGIVGREALKILDGRNIEYLVYDRDSSALADIPCDKLGTREDIPRHRFILDFTNEGGWLEAEDVQEDALYASPGVPCSLTSDAEEKIGKNAVYDNLEIGTAVMLCQALFE